MCAGDSRQRDCYRWKRRLQRTRHGTSCAKRVHRVLDVPYAQLEKRLTNITTRGVVMKKGYTLRDLYQERQTLYRQYAQVTVDCGTQDVEACVRELVTQLEQ